MCVFSISYDLEAIERALKVRIIRHTQTDWNLLR